MQKLCTKQSLLLPMRARFYFVQFDLLLMRICVVIFESIFRVTKSNVAFFNPSFVRFELCVFDVVSYCRNRFSDICATDIFWLSFYSRLHGQVYFSTSFLYNSWFYLVNRRNNFTFLFLYNFQFF